MLGAKHILNVVPSTPIDRRESAASTTPDGDSKATKDADTQEFDEYGAELKPEARVWKTYIHEAEKFDLEQFDGWNRCNVFNLSSQAAFFAATCTAFLIESSKSLKENPAETSARRLDQIVILLVGANTGGTSISPLNTTEIIAPQPFSPRPIDICINTLWSFSLITSAAVPPIAMLAKEWCYLFTVGRVGDSWSRMKIRQQRWNGITRWRMGQVIMFLPSLIHMAFLSFAVGLCLYLWDLNTGVAIPAASITLGSAVIYVTSTLLPLIHPSDAVCPYSTAISRFVQRFRVDRKGVKQDSKGNDRIAIEALAWLIGNSADPKSIDTALQAIASADPSDENRKLLQAYGADRMVSWRLIGLDSYSKNYNQISDLYKRALSFFSSYTPAPDLGLDNQGSPPQLQGLEKNIRDARDEINKQIIAYTSSNRHFLPKHNSIQALSIGSTAASRCLRSLGNGVQTQTQELYNTAVDLLEHCKSREARLNPQEIQFLMTGITMLLSSLLVDCSPAASARYVMKLLEIAYTTTGDQEQLPLSYLGLPMVVYALSQHNYPGLTQPPPHSSRSRAQRAIEVIAYYVSHPSELANVSSAMVNLGILELLSDPESYKLNSEDFKTICEAFDPGPREARIHTLPAISNTDIYSRSLKGIIKLISDEQHNMLDENTREVAIVCLTVLNHTRVVQWAAGSSFEQVYTFLIECVLKIPPSGPESYGQNTALDLMQKFHKHVQSQLTGIPSLGLAKSLDKRKIFAKLKEAVEIHTTSNDADFTTHLFAIGQASFLIDFAIKSQLADHEDWIRCLGSFVGNESLSESGELTRRGNNLAE
ncbi:unnamed protein product [Rhizoctonia solani]|uniref:DUF6535 domain-containing protein n=1 Tax=Rhizoctonia solani TaxID=456999 RepID=A0A8H3A7E1_9AGAM|nr:unnamed protein product [Rhizoctonia solani]CAE6443681.1 unnamed protein product [Rhizoctonia solani]